MPSYRRTKNPLVLAPVLSLTFLVAYQTDFVYGNKMQRIIGKACALVTKAGIILQLESFPSIHSFFYKNI